jgi:hypothetical protein
MISDDFLVEFNRKYTAVEFIFLHLLVSVSET